MQGEKSPVYLQWKMKVLMTSRSLLCDKNRELPGVTMKMIVQLKEEHTERVNMSACCSYFETRFEEDYKKGLELGLPPVSKILYMTSVRGREGYE